MALNNYGVECGRDSWTRRLVYARLPFTVILFCFQKQPPSIRNPKYDLANDPAIAAKLLASLLKNKERAIKEALLGNDLKQAHKLVNGGSHGLDRFADAYAIGTRLIG